MRAALARVADDEARHAELAWAIAEWAEPLLSVEERASIAAARRDAARTLADSHAHAADDQALVVDAGLPSSARAVELLDALRVSLWS